MDHLSLCELHVLPSGSPTLLCDNQSAFFLSQNTISHKRANHIYIDYHFVRELVLFGKLHTKFLPTHLQLADIFTKSFPRPLFEAFRSKLHVGPSQFALARQGGGGIGRTSLLCILYILSEGVTCSLAIVVVTFNIYYILFNIQLTYSK